MFKIVQNLPIPRFIIKLATLVPAAVKGFLRATPRTGFSPTRTASLLALVGFACSAPPPAPTPESSGSPFVELGPGAGLVKVHTGGGPDKEYIVEAKGGGSALLDAEGDGDLDIYWVNGAYLEAPTAGSGNALYLNNGSASFTDVAARAGVEGHGWGMGALSGDVDNDGDADLYVTCLQENILYRNDGAASFTAITAGAGVEAPRWSTGAAFADFDLDGDIDLYVAHYAAFDQDEITPLGAQWKGENIFIGPLGLLPEPDLLYRNNGDGTYSDVSDATGISEIDPGYGLGVLFADADADGDADLYVANDSSPNFLFLNGGDGTFAEVALEAGVAFGDMGQAQAGMGLARGDFDGDTQMDMLVTNFEDDYNTLYRNNGDGTYSDVTFALGLGSITLPYVGFGTAFFDADNDADLDLLVANGHVYPQIEDAGSGNTYAQPNFLFENRGAKFSLLLPGPADSLGSTQVSRGAALGDFDNDGALDIFITNLNAAPVLLRNNLPGGKNWLGLRLRATQGNRDAIGARVVLAAAGRRQVREVTAGSSFLGSADRRLHFGLDNAARVDTLTVHWPGGTRQIFRDLPVNVYLNLEELTATWKRADL